MREVWGGAGNIIGMGEVRNAPDEKM